MISEKELAKLAFDLKHDRTPMENLRSNLYMYIEQKDITLKEVSELADIPYETLKTLMYGNSKDCHLSTVVKLAKLFNVSVDELAGCNSMTDGIRKSLQIIRVLPKSYVDFIRWVIDFYDHTVSNEVKTGKSMNVLLPECKNGDIKLNHDFTVIDFKNLPSDIVAKCFMGIKMPCYNYMPKYNKGSILMIANDRPPLENEDSLVYVNGNIYIVHQVINDGKIQYNSIRDGKLRLNEEDIDEVIGYITYVYNED